MKEVQNHMKKFLSLALALIMVLSVMPMAMAASDPSYSLGQDCGHDEWVKDTDKSTPATCEAEGKNVYTCSHSENGTGCDNVKTEYTEKLPHSFTDNTCTGCGKAASELYTVSMSSKELAMNAEAADLKMDVSVEEKGVTGVVPQHSVSDWSSSDTAVATVNSSSGSLTLLAPGKTVISAKVTINGAVLEVSGNLTVKNEGSIVCTGDLVEKFSKSNYIQLEPKLSDDEVTGITWSYETSSTIISVDKNGKVTATAPGSAKITITAEWGTPKRTETTDVYVAFYDTLDSTVVVKSGTSSFMFDDTDVFSAVTLGTTTLTSVKYQNMISVWSYDGPTYDALELSQSTGSSAYGKITNTASSLIYAYDASKVNRFTVAYEDDLMFTCLTKGTFELSYTLYSNGLMVRYGTIEIMVTEGASDITYNTTFSKSITFDESDFYKLWSKSSNKSALNYVVFNDVPSVGELTVDDSTNAADVTTSMYFFYKYSSTTDAGTKNYDLDEVYYTPYSKASKAYEEVLTFTCYGETASETLTGVLTIKVGENVTFTDVKSDDYFYDAVVWAVNEGITNGITTTTFCPDMSCDRAQVVTFLWRAAGEPTPTSSYMPFTDVDKDDYYYEAVLWAVQEGITEGTSKTTFSPKMTVTRGQVVTFLWRALGEKTVTTTNPFTDIQSSDYFYSAVLWAVKNDITNGMTTTTFMPEYGCTRGQIVTFLYRAYND